MNLAAFAHKLRDILPSLCCPLCGSAFSIQDSQSLICTQRHCYDLSRRGYVNFAPTRPRQDGQYSASLFECRQSIFEQGFYAPVMEALCDAVNAYAPRDLPLTMLDAGCGEGSYARYLAGCFPGAQPIGIDLNRDAIAAAAKIPSPAHWLVANLSRLPIQSASQSILLNILTPADYGEFSRVLRKDGLLLKVIPGADYLAQVRGLVKEELRSGEYDNQQVLDHLQERALLLEQRKLHYTLPVTPAQAALFLRMTPMTSRLPPERLAAFSFPEITIHLELLVCRLHTSK